MSLTAAQMTVLVGLVSGAVGSVSTLAIARYTFRKDNREQEEHDVEMATMEESKAASEADRTIALLEKQNALLEQQNNQMAEQLAELKRQGEAREAEWNKREAAWLEEKRELRSRVTELERDYRKLVGTVTTLSYCANAPDCNNYNPGDRRAHMSTDSSSEE